jgi:hypothetical protein
LQIGQGPDHSDPPLRAFHSVVISKPHALCIDCKRGGDISQRLSPKGKYGTYKAGAMRRGLMLYRLQSDDYFFGRYACFNNAVVRSGHNPAVR